MPDEDRGHVNLLVAHKVRARVVFLESLGHAHEWSPTTDPNRRLNTGVAGDPAKPPRGAPLGS
jgi:hypothetical protein